MLEKHYSSPEVLDLLGERSLVAAMLRFEAALARAQAATGLIPEGAAQSIVGTCKVELFDVSQLLRDSGRNGLGPALVASLRETVGLFNPQAAVFVHRGCGSEDGLVSAMALLTRRVLDRIECDVLSSVTALLALAGRYPVTPLLERGLSQAASVSSIGLLCGAWAAPLLRSLHRLRRTAGEALCVQLDSALDPQGAEVTRRMAQELALGVTTMPGATRSDEWVVLGCELGVLASHLGKVAQDLALLGLPEVGEVQPELSAGSRMAPLSAAQTVPHRVAMLLTALARQDARTLDAWMPDWTEWTRLLLTVHGSARALAQVLPGLQVDTARMRQHIDAQRARLSKEAGETGRDPGLAPHAAARAEQQLQTLQHELRLLQSGAAA
ncbi:MAG: 3-carboxy-cis,cis-muconate cycloisomerase [Burkholderiales bacterium]|nr:3-carboxy-cis,cis-muconate cycloisomerase [Burkholderiales bacterium]